MNTLNVALTQKIATDVLASKNTLTAALGALSSMPAYATAVLFSPDYDLRSACKGDKRATNSLVESLTHAAWREFFSEHDAHHLLLNRERDVQNVYTFSDDSRRSHYNGVRQLHEFTFEAAQDFFNKYLLVNDQKAAIFLSELLDRTGKDYRNHCTAFKTKMSLRGLDSYGTVADELARAVYAICLKLGIDFTFNAFYTELRNKNKIDGNAFNVVEGLEMTFEYHANGNATMRLGKELVTRLNDLAGV